MDVIMCNPILLPVRAGLCTFTYVPTSKVASFPGLPIVRFLIACGVPNWTVERSRYHEVDRSSTLTGDQVYGASKVTYL